MEGISKYLRLRTATVVAALAAVPVVALAVAGSANALVGTNDITIRVIDVSHEHSISAAFCPNGHVSTLYEAGFRSDPCAYTPFTVPYIAANGGRYPEGPWPSATYTANPLGVTVRFRLHGTNGEPLQPYQIYDISPITGLPYLYASYTELEPLYFYAKNPAIGSPFFVYAYGGGPQQRVYMGVQGELQDRLVGPSWVRFHRGGDFNGLKVMTIEICGAARSYCRG